MKRTTLMVMNRYWASVICVVAVATFAVESAAQQTVPPEKVVGRQECTVCHVSEQAAWEESSHNTKAWSLLDHPKAAGFAKAIDVKDIKGDSACTKCHGTQRIKNEKLIVAHGNSCESCHGGSGGGADGWLKKHFDFGTDRKIAPGITLAVLLKDRAEETPEHRATREQACRTAGMIRSEDAFQIARNCLQCHLVPDEKLVGAGHPMSTRFEFVEWAQGEVRHNFLLNPKQNAEVPTGWSDRHAGGKPDGRKRLMYVAGQLADLAVSLRNRSIVTSTKRNSLGDEANDRILDIQEELTGFDIPQLKEMLNAIGKMNKRSLKAITPEDKDQYGKAASVVESAAKNFVAAHRDGSKLPNSIKIPKKMKGDPH